MASVVPGVSAHSLALWGVSVTLAPETPQSSLTVCQAQVVSWTGGSPGWLADWVNHLFAGLGDRTAEAGRPPWGHQETAHAGEAGGALAQASVLS